MGESDVLAAFWQKLHKGNVRLETLPPQTLRREFCAGAPLRSLWSDSFWLTQFEKIVSFTPFWESAKKEQSCSKQMQISMLQASGKKQLQKWEIISCHPVFNYSVILVVILLFFPDCGNEVYRLWIKAQYTIRVNNRPHLLKFLFQTVVWRCLSSHFR